MINACNCYKSTNRKYCKKHITCLKNKIRRLRTENSKDFWKLINSLNKKTDTTVIPLHDMFEYFRTLNSCAATESGENFNAKHILFNLAHLENNEAFQLSQASLDNPFSKGEIYTAIKKIKANKSSGTDGILNEYIILTKHIFIPIYKKLFNIILENGTVPSDWIKGNIISLYKNKGSKMDPANYRSITLLSCVGKLFTSILYHRISTFLEVNKILNETQSRFRNEYSTIDNIFTLHGLIE